MADTPKLTLPLIAAEQALKHVTHNEALAALDTLVQMVVEELDLATPPVSPTAGQSWGVGSSATGDWAGQDGDIASWTDSGWRFATPSEGWLVWNKDTDAAWVYGSSAWTAFTGATQNLEMLGVNTTADATNKFAVRANSVLLNGLEVAASGTGNMQVALNKETLSDTASFVFQTGYSGRAEIGLVGDDEFVFKVSPDGSSFSTGITIDKDNGFVTLNQMFGTVPSFPAITSAELTVTTSYAVPAPETGVTDTVDTITGGFDGALLVLTGTSGNTLTFSDGAGNLKLGAARILSDFEDSLMLIKRGSDWIELAYASNS